MSAPDNAPAPREPRRPLPTPPPESRPFWQAARGHRLSLPRCNACGKFWFPPSLRCGHCLSDDIHWEDVSGAGKVHSFVTVHRVYHPAFAREVPYVVAVVELAEGPRMLTNIIGTTPEQVKCGTPVTVVFDDVADECTLPKFRLAAG